jgi:hypothetical protein
MCLILLSQVYFSSVVTYIHQIPNSSPFELKFVLVTLQGIFFRPLTLEWGCTSLFLGFLASWTKQVLVSLAVQPIDDHCGNI